jgi:hypothetical protein
MKPLPTLTWIFLLTAILGSVAVGGPAPQAEDPDDGDENQPAVGTSGMGTVVPTAAERAVFNALIGIRMVAIVVRDAGGKPLAGAHVRAFSEDWGPYWPSGTKAITDAGGSLKVSLPSGAWSFFVTWRAGGDQEWTGNVVILAAINRRITEDTTVVLQPTGALKLSQTLDRAAASGYARLILYDRRYEGVTEHLMDLANVSLPTTIWMAADNTFDAVYLTADTANHVACFGELRDLRVGARHEAVTMAACAAYRFTRAAVPFSITQCNLELARGPILISPMAERQHRLTLPVESATTLLVTPGDFTLGYALTTAQKERVEFLDRRYVAKAGETRSFDLGALKDVQVFHQVRDRWKEQQNVLHAEVACFDVNGHKVDQWRVPGPRGTPPASGVSYVARTADRELARGVLPPNLRVDLGDGFKPAALPQVTYEITVTAGGKAKSTTCAGLTETTVENDLATIHAPPYMREYAEVVAQELAATRPGMLALVGEKKNRPKTHVYACVFHGLSASVGGNHIAMGMSILSNGGLNVHRCGALTVEFPHNMGYGHATKERLFLWTPLKAEMIAVNNGRLAALNRGHIAQWSVPAFFDYWSGRVPTLKAYTFPSFYLWHKYQFACHRRYIDDIIVYRDWLPQMGFSEGEALCASYSECSGEDLTTLFRLSGWDVAPQRVAMARAALAAAPRPFADTEEGFSVVNVGRLIDSTRDSGPCRSIPPAPASKRARFGVKFAAAKTVGRIVAHLTRDLTTDEFAATACHLERFDGKDWTPIPDTQREGNPLRMVDITIPPAAMSGIAVCVDRELNNRGKAQGGVFRACCLAFEVYDPQGRSLTRPDLSALRKSAP